MAHEPDHYTVLARKYRPQTFEEVVGQDHVTTTLRNAIQQERVGQAYLFIGTRGVGKTTIARILAKALNCLSSDKPVPVPCGTCNNCVAIRDGNCLDVIEIDGASNRGIEEIRRLRDSVAIAPVSARYKVYIIDEVHMLTREAFNALLKTLEEPPPHVKFCFATTEPHRIPATILSRVQKFELRRIGWADLLTYLKSIAEHEKVDIDEGALATLARAGNGSVRDALSVFDQVLAVSDERITEQQVVALMGWTERSLYLDLHAAVVAQDAQAALDVVHKVIERGRDPEQFVLGLLSFLRDLLICLTIDDPQRVLEESPEYVQALTDAARQYTSAQLVYAIDMLLELTQRLEATEAKQTALEVAVMKLLYARRRVAIDDLFARLEALEQGGGAASAASPAPAPGATPAHSAPPREAARPPAPPEPARSQEATTAPAGPADLLSAWNDVIAELSGSDPKLASMLTPARPEVENDRLVLRYAPEDEQCLKAIDTDEVLPQLRAALESRTGGEVRVTVALDQPESTAGGTKPKTKAELIEKLKQEPDVKSVLELFPGSEIVDAQE